MSEGRPSRWPRWRENLRLLPKATWIAIVSNRKVLFADWVLIPLVILGMLVCVWAINLLLVKLPFTFPASVACMLLSFLALLLSSVVLGRQKTAVPLKYVEPTSDFLLKWISIFFCPSFVLLPVEENNTGMGGIEIGKIIALFLVSFVVFVVLAWAVVKLFMAISPSRSHNRDDEEYADTSAPSPEEDPNTAIELQSVHAHAEETQKVRSTWENSTSIVAPPERVLPRPEPAALKGADRSQPLVLPLKNDPAPQPLPHPAFPSDLEPPTLQSTPFEVSRQGSQVTLVHPPESTGQSNPRTFDPTEALAVKLTPFLVPSVYSAVFLISIPIFYSTSESLPLFLSWNILCFLFAVQVVPPKVRRILHPIITCSFLTVMGIWAMGAIKGWSLDESVNQYSTNSRYLVLFNPYKTAPVPPPGAGDVLFSILDASIVSLAIPMYRYRAELQRHAFEMFSTIIPLALLSMFVYPLVSRAIGIAPSRALAFAARSVTTPLALPMEASLKGDSGLTVVLCILTGVLGAVAGPYLLRMLRVKDSDFITIGVVLGCTSSAISTAALLGTNPRAAAISSLAFVLYGIACVVLASIPPVVNVMQLLAGL